MKYQDIIRQHSKEQAALIEHHAAHGALYARALDAIGHLNLVSCYPSRDDLTVNLSGDKHDLEDAWGALRRLGFNRPASEPKANEPSWCGAFMHEAGATVWLFFTSTVCRRVKVGTKTVEQDVYETVCGEVEPLKSTEAA